MALQTKDGGVPGDWIKTKEALFYNRTGSTRSKGDIVAIDLIGGSSEAAAYATWLADTTPTEGENPLANVVQLSTTVPINAEGAFCVCALEDVADNAIGRFALSGIVQVNSGTSTNVVIGVRLVPVESAYTVATAAATGAEKLIGIALEAGSTGATVAISWAIFDGINGIGFDGPAS